MTSGTGERRFTMSYTRTCVRRKQHIRVLRPLNIGTILLYK